MSLYILVGTRHEIHDYLSFFLFSFFIQVYECMDDRYIHYKSTLQSIRLFAMTSSGRNRNSESGKNQSRNLAEVRASHLATPGTSFPFRHLIPLRYIHPRMDSLKKAYLLRPPTSPIYSLDIGTSRISPLPGLISWHPLGTSLWVAS